MDKVLWCIASSLWFLTSLYCWDTNRTVLAVAAMIISAGAGITSTLYVIAEVLDERKTKHSNNL